MRSWLCSGRTVAAAFSIALMLSGCAAGERARPEPQTPPNEPRADAEIAGESFRRAVALTREGRNADAVQWYRQAAERGHVQAQFLLGTMYRTGRGVPMDWSRAVYWYQLAAGAGDAWAQFSLGTMHIRGEGVPPNIHEGVRLYRLAAVQGHREAQYNLGALYYNGDGVARDYVEAEQWFAQAARQGDAESQIALGRMYSSPHTGIRLDRVRAHAWFTVAARNGHDGALAAARSLGRKMSAAERASARSLARRIEAQIGTPDLPANTGL